MSDLIIEVVDNYLDHAVHRIAPSGKIIPLFRTKDTCSECYKEYQAIINRSILRASNRQEGVYERNTRELQEDNHFNPNPFKDDR